MALNLLRRICWGEGKRKPAGNAGKGEEMSLLSYILETGCVMIVYNLSYFINKSSFLRLPLNHSEYNSQQTFAFAGPTRAIPSGQDRPILPARVANQNTGFASSCPLAAPPDIGVSKSQIVLYRDPTIIRIDKTVNK